MESATSSPSLPATLVGISTSIAYSCANLGISLMAIPALLLLPLKGADEVTNGKNQELHLARQWQSIYNRGHRLGPSTAILSTSSFIYAAVQLQEERTTQRALLFASAGLAAAVFPYTWICILGINNELHRRAGTIGASISAKVSAKSSGNVAKASTRSLVEQWSDLGVTRAALPLVAVAFAALALVV